MCACGVIWSPLDTQPMDECPGCQAVFHLECMRQHLDLRCVECKKDLPRNLIYSHLRGRTDVREAVDGPAQKRQRVEDEEHQESIIQSLKQPKLAYPTLPSDLSH